MNLRLSDAMREAVKIEAESMGISMNAMVSFALAEYLEQRGITWANASVGNIVNAVRYARHAKAAQKLGLPIEIRT